MTRPACSDASIRRSGVPANNTSTPVNESGFRTGHTGTYSVAEDCTDQIALTANGAVINLPVVVGEFGLSARAIVKSEHVLCGVRRLSLSPRYAGIPLRRSFHTGCSIAPTQYKWSSPPMGTPYQHIGHRDALLASRGGLRHEPRHSPVIYAGSEDQNQMTYIYNAGFTHRERDPLA
jgi:hypothetical protein